MTTKIELNSNLNQRKGFNLKRLKADIKAHKVIYIMAIPVIIYYIVFHYYPMYGTIIGFKDFNVARGIWGSRWIGFENFQNFFRSLSFWRVVKNTLVLNVYSLIIGFPMPIIFALLLNEVNIKFYKKTIQTITYMPHFISTVVICGILVNFCATRGVFNYISSLFGGTPQNFLMDPRYFRTIFIASNIWTGLGWNSIIYLAALSNIDTELYDSAKIDGAGTFGRMFHVTIPGILPTVTILLILQIGQLMSLGWEKIILLYNPLTYETADVISTFVYRRGLQGGEYGFSTAVGLFNSVVNLILIVAANKLSRTVGETSLW